MTGRSIFFGRVCSLRLFPLFPFPHSPFRTMVPRFLVLQGKYSSRSQKKLAWPARIHGTAADMSTVMEGSIAKNHLVEFIGFCFMTRADAVL